jgi:hypothetical protein
MEQLELIYTNKILHEQPQISWNSLQNQQQAQLSGLNENNYTCGKTGEHWSLEKEDVGDI